MHGVSSAAPFILIAGDSEMHVCCENLMSEGVMLIFGFVGLSTLAVSAQPPHRLWGTTKSGLALEK